MDNKTRIWVFLVLVVLGSSWFLSNTDALTPDDQLYIYVVPHSHCDPGWWWSFEEYYRKWTKGIITSVVDALSENDQRTFIWAEVSFFQRWWSEQPESKKEQVRKLAKRGSLEFVTGGWVAPDEASPHYTDILMELMEGHEWLQNNVGVKPKIGWSIDPFGHSPVIPYLVSQMGLDGIVINRVHRDTKSSFREKKQLEFVWRQSWEHNLDSSSDTFDMFTHMLAYPLYDIPNTCGPEWGTCASFDFERPEATPVTSQNVQKRSKDLLNQYRSKAQHFKHNHLLIPLGDDFKYKNLPITQLMFDSYQMMFDYINNDKSLKVSIKFATLSDYFNAIHDSKDHKKSSLKFPIYHGDFYTYNDKDDDYWSGYFTTRPFAKSLSRKTSSVLRAAESLYSVALTKKNFEYQKAYESFETARRNIGLFQHHDGITGTARVDVVKDYVERLSSSFWSLKSTLESVLPYVLVKESSETTKSSLFDVSSITVTADEVKTKAMQLPDKKIIQVSNEGDIHAIVIHNALGIECSQILSLVVSSQYVKVLDANGKAVKSQMSPQWEKQGTLSPNKFTLYFVVNVPPLGIQTYFIAATSPKDQITPGSENSDRLFHSKVVLHAEEANSKDKNNKLFDVQVGPLLDSISIENSVMTLSLNRMGTLKSVQFKDKSQSMKDLTLNQDFLIYSTSRSGAYLFYADSPASPIEKPDITIHVCTGPIVNEARVSFKVNSAPLTQTVRLYSPVDGINNDLSNMIEISNIVDMTDSSYGNKELVTRFKTSVTNAAIFYTDSNGFDLQKRISVASQPIQSNYYPVTSAILVQDDKRKLTVLTSHSLGATSLQEGEVELMFDRRLYRDDGRGLGEGVMDNVRFEVKLWLLIEGQAASITKGRTSLESSQNLLISELNNRLTQQLNNPLSALVLSPKTPFKDSEESFVKGWKDSFHTQLSLMNSLPDDMNLISLKPRSADQKKLILQVVNESPVKYSLMDLGSFFTSKYEVSAIQEFSSSLLYEKTATTTNKQLHFNADENRKLYRLERPAESRSTNEPKPSKTHSLQYILVPKEIKTFVLELKERDGNRGSNVDTKLEDDTAANVEVVDPGMQIGEIEQDSNNSERGSVESARTNRGGLIVNTEEEEEEGEESSVATEPQPSFLFWFVVCLTGVGLVYLYMNRNASLRRNKMELPKAQ